MKYFIGPILKNMLNHRTRLLLTILAVAWATFSISIMLAIGEGLRINFSRVIENTGTAVFIVSGGQSTKTFNGEGSGVKVILTENDLAQAKQALMGRGEIVGTTEWNVKVTRGKKRRHGPPTSIVDSDYFKLHGIQVKPGGRFINPEDDKNRRQVIVLGSRTVIQLFKSHENPIGQYVQLLGKPFLVIGQQQKTLNLIETNNAQDDYTNWIPYTTYQTFSQDRTYTNFLVAPYHLEDTNQVEKEVIRIIATNHHLDKEDAGIVNIINLEEQKEKLYVFLYSLEAILGIIGTLTLIVAGVGIANVMFISVKRATREIGIKMALGAKPWQILSYYATEALITTSMGGLVGILMAWGIVNFISHIPINSEVLENLGNPKPLLSWTVMCMVIAILSLVGLFAGIMPAKKAALINPAEALRHEQ